MTKNLSSRPISRRAALRAWILGAAPIAVFAAAGPSAWRTAPAATAAQGTSAPAQLAIGTTAASPVTNVAATSCVLTREQTEGPYYIDADLIRSDITEGKEGVPLELSLNIQRAGSCEPIADATVEVWHCDALGEYSGFEASPQMPGGAPGSMPGGRPPGGPGGPPPGGPPMQNAGGPGRNTPTNDLVFLRGGQISDANGLVTFQTIYPGWYRGRTVHIHVKVHVGGQEVHTSQVFFDDAISDQVYQQQPYSAHTNRDTSNARDSIFQEGGQQGLLSLSPSGGGYLGTQTLVVQA